MKQRFFTSESVTKGHPDKLCDQIADGILDALLAQDPGSRVACEVTAEPGHIHIMGEITTEAKVDYEDVARGIIRQIGYTDEQLGLNADTCKISCSVHTQSPDIARGVDCAWEARHGQQQTQGAGDQGMMFGFACSETEQLMPMSLVLSHELARRLTQVRESGLLPYLRPDGKSQVTVEYKQGRPARVEAVVISAQHDEKVEMEQLRADVLREVIEKVIPHTLMDEDTKLYINPTGRFVVGGPEGDAGLTGRKIIVDTYGGMARHGGGSFSGKDASKVDRSAAYMARYIAKNIVAASLAKQCEVQLSYAIGVAQPVQVSVDTAGTCTVEEALIEKLVWETFDLTPAGIIDTLQLTRPMYLPVAAYGHFGRDDLDLPWERTDRAQGLKKRAQACRTAEHQPVVTAF